MAARTVLERLVAILAVALLIEVGLLWRLPRPAGLPPPLGPAAPREAPVAVAAMPSPPVPAPARLAASAASPAQPAVSPAPPPRRVAPLARPIPAVARDVLACVGSTDPLCGLTAR